MVADAVFDRVENRKLLEFAATEKRCAFSGFWLDADPALLWQRVQTRKGGVSDATVDVLSKQLSKEVTPVDWNKLNAAHRTDDLVSEILHHLQPEKPVPACIAEGI